MLDLHRSAVDAIRTGAADVAEWLRTRGARPAAELRP